jgi:GDPmannose 4,6-dehydratase
MQWMMLQQDQAARLRHRHRRAIQRARVHPLDAAELGITVRFEGQGVDEVAWSTAITGDSAPALKVGDVVVRVDPRYFRPTEVQTLLGDPSKAKAELGWMPEITAQDMCLA